MEIVRPFFVHHGIFFDIYQHNGNRDITSPFFAAPFAPRMPAEYFIPPGNGVFMAENDGMETHRHPPSARTGHDERQTSAMGQRSASLTWPAPSGFPKSPFVRI
ncbi:hypothetical protein ACM3C4_01425 [Edwardsiella ictaluri]